MQKIADIPREELNGKERTHKTWLDCYPLLFCSFRATFTILFATAYFIVNLYPNLKLAEKSYEQGLYNFAIKNYLKTLVEDKDPQNQERAIYRLTQTYFQVKNYKRVLEISESYYQNFPQGKWIFTVNYLEALSLVKLNQAADLPDLPDLPDLLKAEDRVKKFIVNHQEDGEVGRFYLLLSEIYQRMKKNDEAEKVLKEIGSKYQSDSLFFLADLYFKNEKHQMALNNLVKVKDDELRFAIPDQVRDLHLELLVTLKKYDKIPNLINKWIFKISDKNIREKYLYYRAHSYFLLKDYVKAVVQYRKYIEENSKANFVLDAYYYSALSYQNMKQPILALQQLDWLEKNKLYPSYPQSFKDQVNKLNYRIYQQIGNEEKSKYYLSQLMKSGKEEGFALKERLFEISQRGSSEVDPWLTKLLKTSVETDKKREDRINFLKSLLFNFFKHNQDEVVKRLSDHIYLLSNNPFNYLPLADYYLSNEKYKLAKDLFLLIISKYQEGHKTTDKKGREDAKNIFYVYDGLGYSYLKLVNYNGAREYFKKNLDKKNPYRHNALFYLAEIDKEEKKFNEAVDRYGLFLKSFPKDSRKKEALYYLGAIEYYQLKDKKVALKHLQEAEPLFKTMVEKNRILLLLSRIESETGNPRQALKYLNRVSKKDSRSYYDALLRIANIHFNMGETEVAVAQYYEIINSFSGSAIPDKEVVNKAYYELFQIKLKQKQAREANFFLNKLKEHSPSDSLVLEGYLTLGDYFFSHKKFKSSVGLYEEFVQYSKNSKLLNYAYFYLAISYQKLKRDEDAHQTFQKLVLKADASKQFDEYYYDANFEMGVYEYSIGSYSQSKKHFDKIIAESPDPALVKQAMKNLEIIEQVENPNPYQSLESPREVIDKINSLKSTTLKEKGYLKLMRIYFEKKRYRETVKWASKVTDNSSSFEAAVMWEIRSLWEMSDYERLYDVGLDLYLSEKFNPAKGDREFYYYAVAYAARVLKYDVDGSMFLVALKKEFPDSSYLDKFDKEFEVTDSGNMNSD